MKLNREKHECSVIEILTRNGFVCVNPDDATIHALWEKDGKQYKFTGWENTPKTALMANNPKYINMEQVNEQEKE